MPPIAELGKVVPPFSAPSTCGSPFTNDSLLGHWTILYFYPKDNTPGCTVEAQEFNALEEQFSALNAVVIGISRDDEKSHDKFRCKFGLAFDLIADTSEVLCTLFDVIRMKNMYGKQVQGIERSTFLIDNSGILIKAWRKVSAKGHAAAILESLQQLQAQ